MYTDDAVFSECWVGVEGALARSTTEWCWNEVSEQLGVDLGASVIATKVVADGLAIDIWKVLGA